MATDEDYPIDLPILVIEAQIFVAVKKLPFLPNKLIPIMYLHPARGCNKAHPLRGGHTVRDIHRYKFDRVSTERLHM